MNHTRWGGETLKQDFNSMAELGEFWSISTWGGDNRTHSAASMTLDGGNIKQWGKANGVKVMVASYTAQYNAPNWKWWPSRPTN